MLPNFKVELPKRDFKVSREGDRSTSNVSDPFKQTDATRNFVEQVDPEGYSDLKPQFGILSANGAVHTTTVDSDATWDYLIRGSVMAVTLGLATAAVVLSAPVAVTAAAIGAAIGSIASFITAGEDNSSSFSEALQKYVTDETGLAMPALGAIGAASLATGSIGIFLGSIAISGAMLYSHDQVESIWDVPRHIGGKLMNAVDNSNFILPIVIILLLIVLGKRYMSKNQTVAST